MSELASPVRIVMTGKASGSSAVISRMVSASAACTSMCRNAQHACSRRARSSTAAFSEAGNVSRAPPAIACCPIYGIDVGNLSLDFGEAGGEHRRCELLSYCGCPDGGRRS